MMSAPATAYLNEQQCNWRGRSLYHDKLRTIKIGTNAIVAYTSGHHISTN